jgi:hypothetical protein
MKGDEFDMQKENNTRGVITTPRAESREEALSFSLNSFS